MSRNDRVFLTVITVIAIAALVVVFCGVRELDTRLHSW